jgi:uncharacterized glyoxalase superfamily protein PhnB
MRNRSVPADIVLPHISYRDVEAAVAWLGKTFGFTEHYRYGEPISGAQMYLGKAYIMVNDGASPAQVGHGTQSLTIFVNDVAEHYARTKAAGARIVLAACARCEPRRMGRDDRTRSDGTSIRAQKAPSDAVPLGEKL